MEFYSKKHQELLESWVAHEMAGAPDDDYAERLLDQLDFYEGGPARQRSTSSDRRAEIELNKQSCQIAYEAAARQGFPLGPMPRAI